MEIVQRNHIMKHWKVYSRQNVTNILHSWRILLVLIQQRKSRNKRLHFVKRQTLTAFWPLNKRNKRHKMQQKRKTFKMPLLFWSNITPFVPIWTRWKWMVKRVETTGLSKNRSFKRSLLVLRLMELRLTKQLENLNLTNKHNRLFNSLPILIRLITLLIRAIVELTREMQNLQTKLLS